MIQQDRILHLNRRSAAPGDFVLYWMQASQRARYNHALEYAIRRANDLHLPIVVAFCLIDDYPEANMRHFAFMLEGLQSTLRELRDRNIETVVKRGSPLLQIPEMAARAALVVTDRGYLRHQKLWRAQVAERLNCPLIQVETDAIVPVESASRKAEYSAATLRPKIGQVLLRYLVPLEAIDAVAPRISLDEGTVDLTSVAGTMHVDTGVPPVTGMSGGASEAENLLTSFLETKLPLYDQDRNNPAVVRSSRLSPYIHFGQISPLYIGLRTHEREGPGVESFLEELIIRRELSLNYVHYHKQYDSLSPLPAWARATLNDHAGDKRPYLYDLDSLERGETHDAYWNAAQLEMVRTGTMHNYMRMYWGKKLIEWSTSAEEAFKTAVYLNNRWELDGRDPNSYSGIAWCFGMHDRAWSERPIFGKVRYMNARGLERKFDMKAYLTRINAEGVAHHATPADLPTS